MTNPTSPMLEKMAKSMFEHEWAGQRPPKDEWRQSRQYWTGFAKVALQSLKDLDEGTVEAMVRAYRENRPSLLSEDAGCMFTAAINHILKGEP